MESLYLNNSEFMSKCKYETAKQNQKISFPFLFPLRGGGVGGGDARKMQGNFWFLHTRVRERVRGALYRFTTQSERPERFRATTHAERAISRYQDFVGKKFGFCSGDTAKFQNSFFRQNAERRKATRLEFPPEFAKGF